MNKKVNHYFYDLCNTVIIMLLPKINTLISIIWLETDFPSLDQHSRDGATEIICLIFPLLLWCPPGLEICSWFHCIRVVVKINYNYWPISKLSCLTKLLKHFFFFFAETMNLVNTSLASEPNIALLLLLHRNRMYFIDS